MHVVKAPEVVHGDAIWELPVHGEDLLKGGAGGVQLGVGASELDLAILGDKVTQQLPQLLVPFLQHTIRTSGPPIYIYLSVCSHTRPYPWREEGDLGPVVAAALPVGLVFHHGN